MKFLLALLLLMPPPGVLYVSWNPVTTFVSAKPFPAGTSVLYIVERGASSTGPWTRITTTPATMVSDTNLMKHRVYYYRVRALVNGIEAKQSVVVAGNT